MEEYEEIKFKIGDIVTPNPELVFEETWLANHVGKTAVVESFGLKSMFSIRWLDNGWRVTMSNEKYILAEEG